MRRLFTGKERFSRHPTISLPTAPAYSGKSSVLEQVVHEHSFNVAR